MDLATIKKSIENLFSSDGLQISKFKIFCPPDVSTSIRKTDDGININFNDKLPFVKAKRMFIAITIEIEGLVLRENGGTIRLKYFPDFDFSYDLSGDDAVFGSAPSEKINLAPIKEAILKQYPDPERGKIAKLALQYANEWVNIARDNGINIEEYGRVNRKKLNSDCESFVKDSIINSKEIEAKSAILTFVLMYFILPAIVSWVVKKFLDNFFK